MKRKILVCLFLFVLLPSLLLAAESTEDAGQVEKMDLPAYAAFLGGHKGKIVVVNMFATWCPPCREEIPGLVSLSARYTDKVVFLGLSVDENPVLVLPFAKAMGIPYTVRHVDENFIAATRISSVPHNFIYGKDGTLKLSQAGYIAEDVLRTTLDALLEEK